MRLPDGILGRGVSLKDQYFDLRGLGEYSSLSVSTLRLHIRADGLPSYLVGGKILVRRSEFDSWISKFRVVQNVDINGVVDSVIGVIGRRS